MEARLAVALAVVVVAIRLWVARPLSFCGTPDACYYLGMAQNLASGQGFHARFLFDLQQTHLTLPNTGIEYWRPGISLILFLLKPLGGASLHSSIAVTVLTGVLYAASAWHFARHTFGDRRIALGGFSLALLSSPAWTGSLTPDSGLYYGAAVAWFLAFFTVRRQGLLQDLVALVCVCAAYLIRNDAVLLLCPLVAVLWARHRLTSRAPGSPSGATNGGSLGYAVLLLGGFLLALVPMHLLYRAVLGTAFPAGTSQALYLNDLSDFLLYKQPVNAHTLFAHGVKHLVLFRLTTLFTVVYRIAVLMIGYASLVFLPGLFLGGSRGVGEPGTGPAVAAWWYELIGPGVFFAALVVVYSTVLPAVGGFSALRTAVGVIPVVSVLVMLAIAKVARTPEIALALATAVILANALSGFMDDRRDVPAMNRMGDTDRREAKELAALGANPRRSVVLTADPVQFSVTTGYATIAVPVNGLDAMVQAARDLHATHVMLDTEGLPTTSDEVSERFHAIRSAIMPAEHMLILELPPAPEVQAGGM